MSSFKYSENEIVNKNLRIIKNTRYGKKKEKAYVVQSVQYPDAPTYIVTESNLNQGRGDAYASHRKIYEGNSLWSIEDIRKYIVNEEEAKTIAPKSRKKITVKCPECQRTKAIAPYVMLKNNDIQCTECGKRKMKYRYKKNDIVNGLKIVSAQKKGNKNIKYYKVQSMLYPNAPLYFISENNLVNGRKDAYISGRRVCIDNSLFSVEDSHKYLVDLDKSKKIFKKSHKKIEVICPNCSTKQFSTPYLLYSKRFSCKRCRKGKSYNELIFDAYQEYFGLDFVPEFIFKELPNRRFDFYSKNLNMLVECHGIGHYQDSGYLNSTKAKFSDNEKRKFARTNDILFIEIDCRESSFDYFKNSINNIPYLPNIKDEDIPKITDIYHQKSNIPINYIIKLYNDNYDISNISNITNVSKQAIRRILNEKNIPIKSYGYYSRKKVRCINNNKIFESVKKASEYAGIKNSGGIITSCKNIGYSAGKHPVTSEKLYWEYV